MKYKQEEKFHKKFPNLCMIEVVKNGHKDIDVKEKVIKYISKLLKQQRDKIKKDLLKIADKGELEELRREILNYFRNL